MNKKAGASWAALTRPRDDAAALLEHAYIDHGKFQLLQDQVPAPLLARVHSGLARECTTHPTVHYTRAKNVLCSGGTMECGGAVQREGERGGVR